MIVNQLMDQMTTVGFCLITNFEGHDEQSLLKAITAFHYLPLEKKLMLSPKHVTPGNANGYQGYFPFIDGNVALKEFYSMPRPFSDISSWEKEGCKLYEEIPWFEDPELEWIR